MNDRMSDMDELVELAAEAIFDTPIAPEHPVDWDCMPPEIADMVRAKARAALEAVGLPALLERVEAAEGDATWLKGQWEDACAEERRLTAERDALAAKVARVEALVNQWESSLPTPMPWVQGPREGTIRVTPTQAMRERKRNIDDLRTALDASETP